MTENQFDDFFRKKLQHHESAVPEDMWQRIDRRKNKRRRFIFWWSLAAVLLIGITTGSYFLVHNGTKESVVAVKQSNQKEKETISSQSKKSSIEKSNSTQTNLSRKEANKNNGQQADITAGKQQQKSSASSGETNAYNHNDKRSVKALNKANNSRAGIEPIKPEAGNNNTQKQKDTYVQNNNQSQQMLEEKDKETSLHPDTLQKNETVKSAPATQAIKSADSSITQNVAVKTGKKKKERTPKDSYIELYASPDYAWKQTSSANQYSDYLKTKNGAEKSTLSFSVGFRYVQMLNSHFFIKTGLQFSQINEQFKYKSLNEYRTISVDVSRSILIDNGYTFISSRSLLRQVGYRIVEQNNRYSSFDIPLLIGYETNGSSSFKASVTSGVIFNIHSAYKGYMVDSTLKAVNINDAGAYKSQMGTSLYFSLGLSKKISDNLSLFGEPYIRYRLSSMTQPSQPFNQKIHSAGLSLGVRYKF